MRLANAKGIIISNDWPVISTRKTGAAKGILLITPKKIVAPTIMANVFE